MRAFPKDSVARIRVIPFETRTLSDEAFRAGDKTVGAAIEIAGVLRLPIGSGPFPAVVLSEGSSGIGSNVDFWDRPFLSHGIVVRRGVLIDAEPRKRLKYVPSSGAWTSRSNRWRSDTPCEAVMPETPVPANSMPPPLSLPLPLFWPVAMVAGMEEAKADLALRNLEFVQE